MEGKALELVKAYENEVDYTVWSDLAANLGVMATVWSNEPNFDHFKTFLRKLYSPIGKKLGWDPKPKESDLDTLLRSVVLNQLGSNDDKAVVAEAKRRFENNQTKNEPISADIRSLVYKLVVANGDEKDYEAVLKIYKTAELHEEKLRALRALGYNTNPEIIQKTLKFALSGEVREQDIFYVTSACSTHRVGRELTWKFIKDNWSDFHRLLGGTAMLIDRLIGYATKDFANEEKAKDVEEFFKAHPVPAAERTIKQSVETIVASSKWLNANRDSVAKWLSQQQ